VRRLGIFVMSQKRQESSCSPEEGLVTIGWKERIDFPEWHLRRVKAKIDTGARTSALDAAGYEIREAEGILVAEIQLSLRRKSGRPRIIHAPVLGIVAVANSAGIHEERPLIETLVQIGPVRERVRFTVTNRSRMRFPVILGRSALAGHFVVDVRRRLVLDERQGQTKPRAD
jgi:hypothetical protein